MKKLFLLLACFIFSLPVLEAQGCTDCNTLYCDGYTCEDGTGGDGVQTSRKCSCGEIIQGACAKVELVLSGHPLYDPTKTSAVKFSTQESGNFSIYFTDENCGVNDCNSPDITVTSNSNFSVPAGDTVYMVICKNGGNAGRRDMNFEYFPVQASETGVCSDGFDNDLDGATDCDDADCTTSCGGSGSGGGGGTESNDRLAGQIGFRNYKLLKKGSPLFEPLAPEAIDIRQIANFRNTDELGAFQDYLPGEALNELLITEATPAGLTGITNATKVFAIDADDLNGRVGTILMMKTEDGVYEHTKYICDRLLGNVLDRIYKKAYGKDTLITYKMTEKGRVPEYCVSFSVRLDDNGGVIIENHWTLDRYPRAAYMNIQIWTSTESRLEEWVKEVISNLRENYSSVALHSSAIPSSFVRRGWMENGQIKIEVQSREDAGSVALRGIYSRTEKDNENYPFAQTFTMDSLAILTWPIGVTDFFDMGFRLEDAHGVGDDLYFADGQWGLDDSHLLTDITNFQVTPQEATSSNGFPLRRAVSLEGRFGDYVAVYRALHPRFKALDLSAYNSLTFSTSGEGTLEVTLFKESILDWAKHYKTSVLLSEEAITYELPFSQFSSPGFSGAFDAQDLVMVVFTVRSPDGEQRNIKLDLGNLSFERRTGGEEQRNITVGAEDMLAYPSPFSNYLEIKFSNIYEEPYEVLISNVQGQVLLHKKGRTINGINQVRIGTSAYREGMYFIHIRMLKGGVRVGKVFCKQPD